MGLRQICVLVLCFAGVLTDSINNSNYGGSETKSFIDIGNKHYLINTVATMNWFQAYLYCHTFDSDLAVIKTPGEMNALNFYLIANAGHVDTNFWLGVTDLAEQGKYVSFRDGRPMPYAKWSAGQPDNFGNNEHCVHLWLVNNIFYMNDNNCNAKLYAICEMRQPRKGCDVCDLKNLVERFLQFTNVPNCENW
ncbi:C-type lectin 37Db-like [Bactrocera neohumeralis]|uniref:C-type lectin 37Db-like n=1 Tax=Bactrocera neohumeralis TaxID=98809 RepID=UPI00216515C6|nr:C-type lectin 37Db-like [Bactrocera neohumeralis]